MDIIAPVITPFRGGRIDLEAYADHIKNIVRKGVDVVFVAGTTGLGPALTAEEKKALLEAASSAAKRVIFHVASLRLEEAVELAKYAERFGVEAVASVPPYYFPRISERQIARYFRDLCAATSAPLYLYNYPAATGKDVGAPLVKEIGCIRGVKDTNEEIAHTLAYKRLMPEIRVYNGADSLIFASMAVGLDGVVVSAANYLPEAVSAIREAVAAGDVDKARRLQFLINEVLDASRPLGYFAAVYELVKLFQGYDVGEPRPPIYPLEAAERTKLAAAVEKIKERI
nr:MAG: 2-dehydro-3-deoxyphosphogluconate aldolase [Thermoproteus sp. AZ2]